MRKYIINLWNSNFFISISIINIETGKPYTIPFSISIQGNANSRASWTLSAEPTRIQQGKLDERETLWTRLPLLEEDPLEPQPRIGEPANNGRTANKAHYIAAINCIAILNLRTVHGKTGGSEKGRKEREREGERDEEEGDEAASLLETLPVSSYR